MSIKLVIKTYISLSFSSAKKPIILASQLLVNPKSVNFKLPKAVDKVPTSESSD